MGEGVCMCICTDKDLWKDTQDLVMVDTFGGRGVVIRQEREEVGGNLYFFKFFFGF